VDILENFLTLFLILISPMTAKSALTYEVGDRVAERPKACNWVSVRAEVRERIAPFRAQRYGTVVGTTTKRNSRGANQKFLVIQWDHLASPTEHAQMRICPINQLSQLQAEGYGMDV
jgi:hypothetical protein